MEYRMLEITLEYAKDLNRVNLISKMRVYVVVSISGGDNNSKQTTKTPVDNDGDTDPTWRLPMKFKVEEAALQQDRLMLDFNLKCQKTLGDRDVGEVHVAIKDLLHSPASGGGAAGKKFVSYQVMKPNGKPKGQLTFSYRFRERNTTVAAGNGVLPTSSPNDKMHSESTTACLSLDSSTLYPTTGQVSHYRPLPTYPTTILSEEFKGYYLPPIGYSQASGKIPEWYPPPPRWAYPPPLPPLPPPPLPPPLPPEYVYPPPLMQLAPNWWIVDWRYDSQFS